MKIYGAYFVLSILLGDVLLVESPEPINLEKDNIYDLNRICAQVATVKNYMDIHINNLKGSRACNVTLEADEKKSTLKAYFKKYKAGDACSGAVNLYDSRNFAQLGNEGYCKSEAPKGHYELGTSGTLSVAKGDSSIDAVIRVVEYYIKDKECPEGKFDCQEKNLCIAKSIACDKSADCPNSKDEGDECPIINWRPLYTLIVFVGIVLAFCVCAMVVWEETSRKKRGNRPLPPPEPQTIAPGRFDGAYTEHFGVPEKQPDTEPTAYSPIRSSPAQIPATTTSPV
ncbi:unnamed protein product [Lymnaea stagnalis]|uniref:Uncharacterized protein n=1 Tax=Lymnaea stagnalis TaxID=6523 RepID=A0AAV2HHA8_LYMST